MSKRQRALIIGGSLAGLFAANLLRKCDWDVDIYERTQGDLASRGAGIGTYRQLFEIMASLGIDNLEAKCIPLYRRLCFDLNGEVIHEINQLHTMSAWSTIYDALRKLVSENEYHSGKQLVDIEQNANKVTAIFSDGSRETGDLLVGADGLRSTVRQHYAPEVEPVYAGYIAWRGMVEENDFSPEDHAQIFENYAFGFPEGEQFLAYPVLGRTNENVRGKRAYNFVWYRPARADTELRDLCTDENGLCHGTAIAPPLIRNDVIEDLKTDAKRLLAPQLAWMVNQVPRPFFQAINDLESKQLVFGRVALIGDAAFIARPHVGGGITKAAIDADNLARALAAHASIDAGLAEFEQQSLHFGRGVVDRARGLGAYLEGQLKPLQERTLQQQSRDVRKVMQEQGAALTNELLSSDKPAH